MNLLLVNFLNINLHKSMTIEVFGYLFSYFNCKNTKMRVRNTNEIELQGLNSEIDK